MAKPAPSLAALAAQVRKGSDEQPGSLGRSNTPEPKKKGPRPADRKGEPMSREGKKGFTVFYPPEVHEALRQLRHHENTTNQALIGEAIDMLMRDRGLSPFGAR